MVAAVMSELASGGYTEGHIYEGSGEIAAGQGWIPLGASRNIKLNGESDDDNSLTAYMNGVGYKI